MSARRVGRTFWIARPVSPSSASTSGRCRKNRGRRRPRRSLSHAATRSYPNRLRSPPEGYALVNEGRIFTPFVGEDPTIVKPGIWGGANWPPSSYDPRAQHLFVCASSVLNGFTGGGDPNFAAPVPGGRYAGGLPMTPR